MNALRILLRLLPALAGWLVISTQPVDRYVPAQAAAIVASHERDARPPWLGDLVTRSQRHASSLEEYFAIDDDTEVYASATPGVTVALADSAPMVWRSSAPPRFCEVLPNHRPCAAPATGPPHA